MAAGRVGDARRARIGKANEGLRARGIGLRPAYQDDVRAARSGDEIAVGKRGEFARSRHLRDGENRKAGGYAKT